MNRNVIDGGVDASAPRVFDVVCAGEALWSLGSVGPDASNVASSPAFLPGGGALGVALPLARRGLRIGLATTLADDSFGRNLRDRVAQAGVDVAGVSLTAPRSGLVFVERMGGARQVVALRDEEESFSIPDGWASKVLLLSGLSPVVSRAGALCKAARAGRRAGSTVVVEVNARPHLWKGRDDRSVRMILREADVVHCTAEDLWALGVDLETLKASLRPLSVLVMSGPGGVWASGPFGEIVSRAVTARAASGPGVTAAICTELTRTSQPGEARLWERAIAER